MTWAADVALYNTAVNALTKFIVSRENNTPSMTVLQLSNAAQAALDAIATPLSASPSPKMPRHHPSL